MKKVWKVRRVAAWDGWCSPCGRDDRPLVLTRSGAAGLLAWLTGHGDEERCLLLTCRVCGQWQVVPHREEDDPEVVLVEEQAPAAAPAAAAAAVRPVVTAALAALPEPALLLPRPRVSPESVAAAHRVLSAARASSGTPAPAARSSRTSVTRTAAAQRRGSRRRGPTPRRPDSAPSMRTRGTAPAPAPTGPASVALPADTVLDLLALGHQVVLSPA